MGEERKRESERESEREREMEKEKEKDKDKDKDKAFTSSKPMGSHTAHAVLTVAHMPGTACPYPVFNTTVLFHWL